MDTISFFLFTERPLYEPNETSICSRLLYTGFFRSIIPLLIRLTTLGSLIHHLLLPKQRWHSESPEGKALAPSS